MCRNMYYEWLKKGKERLPYFTKHQNGNLMLLAGLYDRVVLEGSTEPLWTFTVVTTAACKELSWLHDRQPLVEPHHDSTSPLVCYQVPKEVGKIGTESPSFIEPIAERKDGIQAMFTQQHGTKTSPSPPKAKRKRSPSPRINSPVEDNKKPKIEKANACENDSYTECIDDPSAAGSSNTQLLSNRAASSSAYPSTEESPGKSRSTAKRVKSPSSPKKAKMPAKKSSSSSKITSFFGKT
ncbi:hypothetical protein A0H81_05405 [Grifola frondosa]|uniref:Uncharacterized protein n=1 Tax=Grifola frondosa TaxID=5627 RepID=A0A1C7MCG5_GRIFR|nr:hypothetical protein A0H81_05405 [Grifola frondosa]